MSNPLGRYGEDVEYIPLMQNAEDTQSDRLNINHESNFNKDFQPPSRFHYILIISAVFVSFLSFFWSSAQFLSHHSKSSALVPDVASLRRPSLYIGLDRVRDIQVILDAQKSAGGHGQHMKPSDSSSPGPTLKHPGGPRQIVRINSGHPGTSYPQDGWVLLSEKDSIIMEFQPPESSAHCKIGSFFPERRSLGNKMLTLEGQSSSGIEVQPLPSSSELNGITWNSRPIANSTIGSLQLGFGRNDTTASFPCSSSMPVVVQLSCVEAGCRVEYKDDAELAPLLGYYLLPV